MVAVEDLVEVAEAEVDSVEGEGVAEAEADLVVEVAEAAFNRETRVLQRKVMFA